MIELTAPVAFIIRGKHDTLPMLGNFVLVGLRRRESEWGLMKVTQVEKEFDIRVAGWGSEACNCRHCRQQVF